MMMRMKRKRKQGAQIKGQRQVETKRKKGRIERPRVERPERERQTPQRRSRETETQRHKPCSHLGPDSTTSLLRDGDNRRKLVDGGWMVFMDCFFVLTKRREQQQQQQERKKERPWTASEFKSETKRVGRRESQRMVSPHTHPVQKRETKHCV
jgi:hypothetical protein